MKYNLTRILEIAGIGLIVLAVGTMLLSGGLQKHWASEARQTAEILYSYLPPVQNGIPEERTNPAMPVLEIDGNNYAGILEIPAYNTFLPIGGQWDRMKILRYPCIYAGSIFEDNLILGGSDAAGQLDFMKKISNGERIWITDMTGIRMCYEVSSIERTPDVSADHLTGKEEDFVIFARNTYAFDYTVIRCIRKS